MDFNRLKAALVADIYDNVRLSDYGHGVLIATPLTYSDGDNVIVLAEPFGNGVRVTDREEAVDRLEDSGVDLELNKRARSEREELLRHSQLLTLGATPLELSHVTDSEGAARAVWEVALLAQKVEQLRYLAREVPTARYRDVVAETTRTIAQRHQWKVRTNAKVRLRTGSERHVTARVETSSAAAYLQALSTPDALAATFLTFSYLDEPKGVKLAVIDERSDSWRSTDLEPIGDVGSLVRYRSERDLVVALERIDRTRSTLLA